MTKRIHKTLEEVEAENEFDVMHTDVGDGFEAYEEEDLPAEDEDEEVEEYEEPEEDEAQEFFDELTDVEEEIDDLLDTSPEGTDYAIPDRPDGEPPHASTGPTPAIIVGSAVTLGGFILATLAIVAPDSGSSIARNLASAGLTPGLIVCLGVLILTIVAVVRRQHQTLQSQIEWVMGNHEANAEILDSLFESRAERTSMASTDELEPIMHSLMRQDEKINNLTKALKMYGKPLVDVNRQAAENGQKTKMISTQVADLKELVEQLGQPQDQSELIEGLQSKLDELAELLKGELSKAVSALPKDDGKDEILQTLRRELGQINDSIARVQVAAPASHAPARAPAAQSPQSKPAPAPSTPPAGEGPAKSISGTAKSSGKAVMGAIAKLKKMR